MKNVRIIWRIKLTNGVLICIMVSKGGALYAKRKRKQERPICPLGGKSDEQDYQHGTIYEYSDADVEKIFSAIESSVKEARKKFAKSEAPKSVKFTLR